MKQDSRTTAADVTVHASQGRQLMPGPFRMSLSRLRPVIGEPTGIGDGLSMITNFNHTAIDTPHEFCGDVDMSDVDMTASVSAVADRMFVHSLDSPPAGPPG